MLGSAAVSLVNVAKGSIDVYSEKNIMLWDVLRQVWRLFREQGEASIILIKLPNTHRMSIQAMELEMYSQQQF